MNEWRERIASPALAYRREAEFLKCKLIDAWLEFINKREKLSAISDAMEK